jgi:glycosyltransferase involved in cell wall biosynthesis
MLGLIARADSRGLGVQTKAFHDHMHPAKTLVVDCPSAMPLPIRNNWYPDATWVHGIPSREDLEAFCDGLTGLYTAETGYNTDLWGIAESHGVRTVLHANYEFLHHWDRPTVWAAPSLWHFDDFPRGAIYLPVPIETHRFHNTYPPDTAKHFLHVVGRPAVNDRNGTIDFLASLQYVQSSIEVTVTCQQQGYVEHMMSDHSITIPDNVAFTLKSGDTDNYWDNFKGVDALILPRRFGGLCLPANEAVGAGIPVIMPNIEPNSRWLPEQWRVPAEVAGEFKAKQHIIYYRTDHKELANKVDQLAQDENFYSEAITIASKLRHELSWETLTPTYENLFA